MSGPWNPCCCPSCNEVSDNWDCCSDPRCGTVPAYNCCYNPALLSTPPTYGTIPTQNLGGGWQWKTASGSWWQQISTMPAYLIKNGQACNDGALYETSGTGSLTSSDDLTYPKAKPENQGFALQIDIVDYVVGTDFKMTCGSISVELKTTNVGDGIHWLQTVTLSCTGGTCTWTLTETIPTGHARHTLYVFYDAMVQAVSCGLDTIPYPTATWMICVAGANTKSNVVLQNKSGGGIPLELDNFFIYKQQVYPEYGSTLSPLDWCYYLVSCLCTDPVTHKVRKSDYSTTLYLKIVIACPCGAAPYSVTIPLYQTVTPGCASCLFNTWTSDYLPMCATNTQFKLTCDDAGWLLIAYPESNPTAIQLTELMSVTQCKPFTLAGTADGNIFGASCCVFPPGCFPPPPYTMALTITEVAS